jgi:hypothetical protein
MVLPGLLIVFSLAGLGCTAAASRPDAAAPAAGRTVRVAASQFGSAITVRVGDVLKVERPAAFETWTVDFSRDVLRSLNTEEGLRTPPADGWTFAVVGAGTTDLVVTAHPEKGGGTPNTPRFILSITAE